jgi:uncharacterized delta-60 repeat protein
MLVVQSDGKIVVAGLASSPSGATTDAVLIRYDIDGSLDDSFGIDGVARVDFGGDESFRELVLLPDGRFVAGGQQSDTKWMLARFTRRRRRTVRRGDGSKDIVSGGIGVDSADADDADVLQGIEIVRVALP